MRAQLITMQSFKVFCRTFGHIFMYFTSNLWLKYSPKQDLLVSRVCPIKSHNFNTVLSNKKIYSQLATWKKILYFSDKMPHFYRYRSEDDDLQTHSRTPARTTTGVSSAKTDEAHVRCVMPHSLLSFIMSSSRHDSRQPACDTVMTSSEEIHVRYALTL